MIVPKIGMETKEQPDVNPLDEFYTNPIKRFYTLSSTESDSSDDPPNEEMENIMKETIEFSYENTDEFPENWYYSQFWYDEPTTKHITKKIHEICKDREKSQVGNSKQRVCCLCCPTIFRRLLKEPPKNSEVFLFDVDEAKCQVLGSNYIFYDFNRPKEMDEKFQGSFDIVVADTPHFTEICIRKIIITIQHVKNSTCQIMLCTTLDDKLLKYVDEELKLKKTDWKIGHACGLENPYACFTNLNDRFLNVKMET
ncbi:EEF1A lysine methyltransferase 1 [Octopus bimaculoides]|nr:EEF1A lysine methyltransferase 1 [Octopus bimaculoides]|eukprot:XP_014771718.1 PREDICTED: protein-lysine N-methyltransferase N6amt2-like isoform X2 [Octopus bimaculoides]